MLRKFEWMFPEAPASKDNLTVRQLIYSVWGGIDGYTGKYLPFEEMVIDHIVPVDCGGPDNLFNYIPTTMLNNGRKGAKFDECAAVPLLAYVQTTYGAALLAGMNMGKCEEEDPFQALLPKAYSKVIYALREKPASVRQLMLLSGLSSSRPIDELLQQGLLTCSWTGNRKLITLNTDYIFYEDLINMLLKVDTKKTTRGAK